jgi:hypothetical protein
MPSKRHSAAELAPAESCPLRASQNMLLQNPHLALGECQRRVTLWIAASATLPSSVGCAPRSKTPQTVTEVANRLPRDLPVYSEWIGATVGYIDSHIHVSRDRGPHSNGGGSRVGQRAVCPACMRNAPGVDRFLHGYPLSGADRAPSHSSQRRWDDGIEPRSGEVIHA